MGHAPSAKSKYLPKASRDKSPLSPYIPPGLKCTRTFDLNNLLYFQIAAIRKTSKFEDEIREEQENRKREEDEKKQRQQSFKERAAMFGGQGV